MSRTLKRKTTKRVRRARPATVLVILDAADPVALAVDLFDLLQRASERGQLARAGRLVSWVPHPLVLLRHEGVN